MNPKQYRKKPVVIEAVIWDGTVVSAGPIVDWILAGGGVARWHEDTSPVGRPGGDNYLPPVPQHIAIETLEGVMRAEPFNWIICGVEGEFYPCKPGIFAATYEAVDA